MRRPLTLLLFAASAVVSLDARANTIDIVGGTTLSAIGTGLAKGNAYRIDTSVDLVEFEAFLRFSGNQTLNFYVFENSSEFGTYSLVTSTSHAAIGTGLDAFYSSGILNTPLDAGSWYMLAVSWSGQANTYYFNDAPSQATSFGAHVHAFASGTHPLGSTIASNVDDQAVYYQRVTTVPEPHSIAMALMAAFAVAIIMRANRIMPLGVGDGYTETCRPLS
jgi:hypothetical protein